MTDLQGIFICNTDQPDPADEWDLYRSGFDALSDLNGDWQGTPVQLPDHRLVLNDRHPLRDIYREMDGPADPEVLVGGPSDLDADPDATAEELVALAVARSMEDEVVVNHWYSRVRNADVYIIQKKSTGRAFALTAPRSPDGSMDRLLYWFQTMGASDAWSLDAEYTAREKLAGMVNRQQWRTYDLTGAFVETSHRSGLTYVFRRLRPTVVLSPRWPWFQTQLDQMRMLAVLCMHPIGYYEKSWAGCLVPTDDVIAHLLMFRGDEAYYWKCCNQHPAASPEAGL
jgi:hypothetical protein